MQLLQTIFSSETPPFIETCRSAQIVDGGKLTSARQTSIVREEGARRLNISNDVSWFNSIIFELDRASNPAGSILGFSPIKQLFDVVKCKKAACAATTVAWPIRLMD